MKTLYDAQNIAHLLSGADFRTSHGYFIDPKTTNVKGAKFSYPGVLALITALGAKVDL